MLNVVLILRDIVMNARTAVQHIILKSEPIMRTTNMQMMIIHFHLSQVILNIKRNFRQEEIKHLSWGATIHKS